MQKKKNEKNMEIQRVYEYVPDIGQKCISTKWVIVEKFKDKRKIMKACFVVCGYEEDSHNLKTDSPTGSHEAIHIVMFNSLGYEVASRESEFHLRISTKR